MAELGEGVADGIVNRAFAHLAAFDVGDWYAKSEGYGCGRQHFITVRNEKQQIGAHLAEAVGQAERRKAESFRHADVGVGAEEAFEAGVDVEAVFLDFGNGVAELGGEVGSERDELEVQLRIAQRASAEASRDGCNPPAKL